MIKLELLFKKQKELDIYIENNTIKNDDVFLNKSLALIVELAELANEVRSFKYWSKKQPSPRSVILEEYVDILHFLLSIGIEMGFTDIKLYSVKSYENNVTKLFLHINKLVNDFISRPNIDLYTEIWIAMETLKLSLGLTDKEIYEAYEKKNSINYKRQHEGY